MNTRVMKFKELRNQEGVLSALVIKAEDIKELQENLKPNSALSIYLSEVQSSREEEMEALQTMLPNGHTIAETNKMAAKVTEDIHREAFAKGVPMFYRDERTSGKEFVRANPDGSEDLVSYSIEERDHKFIKNLSPAGKGYWSYLLNSK